jgi:Ca2+-binding EF-hand superfamily protein
VTRTLATLSLLGLAGTVLAAPPTPTASGIRGASDSAAPDGGVARNRSFARPRGGAFVTALTPDPRAAIPVRVARPAEIKMADAQEVVVFAPHRPVRIRLGVQSEGKPIAEMWRDKLKKAFDYFDRDKDGVLNDFEVKNIFSNVGLTQMLQNGFYQPTPQDRPTLDTLDADGDRKVSPDEFVTYYKSSAGQILRPVPPQAENPANAAATEALYKLMDADGDGKLTRDEVKAIEAFVATRDSDEDECLSLAELVPNLNPDPRLRGELVVQFDRAGRAPSALAAQTVLTYEAGRVPGTLTQQVIKKYDKDGDFELTREECAFDDPTFARLDTDGNGRLDGEELDVWRTGPADLEVSLSLAPRAADCVAKLVTDANDLAARGFTVKQGEPGRLIVRVGRQPIEFWASGAGVNSPQNALKFQFANQFQQASGGKGFVVEKDLTGPNAVQFQFVRTLFDAADADGDGKMTKAEFDAYFDLQDSFRNVALSVTPAIQTPTLFQLLDENRDGRLGVRELRTSWDRLIALEPGDAEVVTKAAIQPSVSLRLGRGVDRSNPNQFVVVTDFNGRAMNQVPVPQKGPVWFRKMDRNADGDVSRSEYLGTKAEFEAIDADRDALISLAEAEAWDKMMRTDAATKGDKQEPPRDAPRPPQRKNDQ